MALLLNKKISDEAAGGYANYLLVKFTNEEIDQACKRYIDGGGKFFPAAGELARYAAPRAAEAIGSCGRCTEGVTYRPHTDPEYKGMMVARPCDCEYGIYVKNQKWN